MQGKNEAATVVQNGTTVTINCGILNAQIRASASDVIKIWIKQSGAFSRKHSWAVVNDQPESPKVTVTEETGIVTVATEKVKTVVQLSPFRVAFYDNAGVLLCRDHPEKGVTFDGAAMKCFKEMPADEHYYGLGTFNGRNTSDDIDIRGKTVVCRNNEFKFNGGPSSLVTTFFTALRPNKPSYGILFDNNWHDAAFKMGSESSDFYSFEAPGGEMCYYFLYGPSVKQVLGAFAKIAGKPFMPPRWALGQTQCRWGYKQADVERVAKTYREKAIPLDILAWDIEWYKCHCSPGPGADAWNPVNFPDPAGMIQVLRDNHLKTMLILDPNISQSCSIQYKVGEEKKYFVLTEPWPNGSPSVVNWPWGHQSGLIDYTNPEANTWWQELIRHLLDEGLDAFWTDMNEPARENEHMHFHNFGEGGTTADMGNIYGLAHTMATYNAMKNLRPNKRTFVMTRAAWTGIHRYGCPWTGDVSVEELANQIPVMQTAAMSGINLIAHDIGGWTGKTTGPLFARWIQLGVFSPVDRIHSAPKEQEPWVFGEETERIARKYIKLRYRLMPYIYSHIHEASVSGVPILRPLLMEFPNDPATYNLKYQFLFGKDILVAPATAPNATTVQAYLPAGTWIDFDTTLELQGGKTVSLDAPLDHLPLLVRAGAIIPMAPEMQYSWEKSWFSPMTLDIYPEGRSEFSLYEDDGETTGWESGESAATRISVQAGSPLKVSIGKPAGSYTGMPSERTYVLQIRRTAAEPQDIRRDGTLLAKKESAGSLDQSAEGWRYDEAQKTVFVKIESVQKGAEIEVYGAAVSADRKKKADAAKYKPALSR